MSAASRRTFPLAFRARIEHPLDDRAAAAKVLPALAVLGVSCYSCSRTARRWFQDGITDGGPREATIDCIALCIEHYEEALAKRAPAAAPTPEEQPQTDAPPPSAPQAGTDVLEVLEHIRYLLAADSVGRAHLWNHHEGQNQAPTALVDMVRDHFPTFGDQWIQLHDGGPSTPSSQDPKAHLDGQRDADQSGAHKNSSTGSPAGELTLPGRLTVTVEAAPDSARGDSPRALSVRVEANPS